MKPEELLARNRALEARVAELERALARDGEEPDGEVVFLTRVTHDLVAPLTALGGFLELLARGHGGPLDRPQAALVAQARGAGDRLRRVIERTSAWSRLCRGALEADPAAVDLAALLRRLSAARGPRVRLELPAVTPTVTTDAHLLTIALDELLDNALRLAPADAPVTLALGRHNGHARVCVRGGLPLPADWRWPESPRAQPAPGEGSGVGLPLVRGLAGLLGGQAVAERVDERTEFALTLPV